MGAQGFPHIDEKGRLTALWFDLEVRFRVHGCRAGAPLFRVESQRVEYNKGDRGGKDPPISTFTASTSRRGLTERLEEERGDWPIHYRASTWLNKVPQGQRRQRRSGPDSYAVFFLMKPFLLADVLEKAPPDPNNRFRAALQKPANSDDLPKD